VAKARSSSPGDTTRNRAKNPTTPAREHGRGKTPGSSPLVEALGLRLRHLPAEHHLPESLRRLHRTQNRKVEARRTPSLLPPLTVTEESWGAPWGTGRPAHLVRPAVGWRRGPGGQLLRRTFRPDQQVRRRRVGLPHGRRPLHVALLSRRVFFPSHSLLCLSPSTAGDVRGAVLLGLGLSLSLSNSLCAAVVPLSLSKKARRGWEWSVVCGVERKEGEGSLCGAHGAHPLLKAHRPRRHPPSAAHDTRARASAGRPP
jgi:hypothetical protein